MRKFSQPETIPSGTEALKSKSLRFKKKSRAQELCESRGGRPGLPFPNKPAVSVDIKQHFNQGSRRRDYTPRQPRIQINTQALNLTFVFFS